MSKPTRQRRASHAARKHKARRLHAQIVAISEMQRKMPFLRWA